MVRVYHRQEDRSMTAITQTIPRVCRALMGLAVLWGSIGLPGVRSWAIEESEIVTLRGLQGMHVIAEQSNPEVERAGLTAQQLRIDVELQLRKFGIPVLTRDASYRAPGSPYLHVHVTGSGAPSGIYGIAIQLKQRISLERDASVV